MTLKATITSFAHRLENAISCKHIHKLRKARPRSPDEKSPIYQCHYLSTIYEEEEIEPLLAKDEEKDTLTVANEKYILGDLWCDESQHDRHDRRCSSKIPLHTISPEVKHFDSDTTVAMEGKLHADWKYEIWSLQEDYDWWLENFHTVEAQRECLRQELAKLSCKRRNRWAKELEAWFKKNKETKCSSTL